MPQTVWMPGGVRTEIQLTGQDTGGAFCMLVDHPPVGWSLPAHRHRREAETIHVVEGEFEMEIDGRQVWLGPGETVHIPAGVIHSGRNGGDRRGQRLLLFSPAGMERFFVEVGAATADARIEPSRALASAAAHGWEFVGGERRSG